MEDFEAARPEQPIAEPTPRYFATSPIKFIAMSLCTFGLYEVYWSYKNWRFIKDRDGLEIMPFWRAFFYPLWHYSLLTELNKTLKSSVLSISAVRVGLAVCVFVLNIAIDLPDPYWLLSTLTILGFIPALLAMQDRPAKSFHPSNLIAYLLGGPLMAIITLSAIGFIPSTAVITEDKMWDRDIEYLRQNDILGPDEKIAYFYSEGAWSIAEGGQFFSDQFVTSYSQDLETGEIYLDYVEFSRISDIDIAWAETWLDITIVTITTDDDYQFELWLASEEEGDKEFVTELKKRWNRSRE